jgi:hypothetical protein
MKKLLGSQGVLRGKLLRTPVRGAQDDGWRRHAVDNEEEIPHDNNRFYEC